MENGMGAAGAGSLGPRLAGRLTAELILRSPQYMNCCKDYELDLRGNKITEIENLGATENQFDSIDLSDNAVMRLEGFPALKRLKQLLLSNNRLARISKNLEAQIPNLEVLVLSNNRFTNLSDIDMLATLPKLKYLSLLDNPVTKRPDYRLYVVSRLKRLKVLDFKRITPKEREAAASKFPTEEDMSAADAKTFEPGEGLPAAAAAGDGGEGAAAAKPAGPTPAQLTAIQAAIANAQTLEEVTMLEEALATGVMPSGMDLGAAAGGGDDAMEEG
mmetsp:Transcript_35055/g.91045  ORF Transcript_35055/g.91045 Transcript_35055/m.91045 type:complete len:274 (+) Transcript_35055:205-1026(+)